MSIVEVLLSFSYSYFTRSGLCFYLRALIYLFLTLY
jgi:hypothetical protein